MREVTRMNRNPLDTSVSLLERLQQEQFDQAAWREFVDRYGRLLLHWSRKWGADVAEAHDVTQEVLLSLVRQMRDFRYDPARSFRAWLKTVTHRTWAKLREERMRCEAPGGSRFAALFDSLPARENLALLLEQQAERELLDIAIQRVRGRVQPHTWDAFQLLALEECSGEEVSTRLGLPLSSVYVARHNVNKMLREELQLLLGE